MFRKAPAQNFTSSVHMLLTSQKKYFRNGLLNVANGSAVDFKWKCSVTTVADGFSECS